jgi:hypothetical protein
VRVGSANRINETPKLGHSLCAGAMAVIPVSLSLWGATASTMHPADAKATHAAHSAGTRKAAFRPRATPLACEFVSLLTPLRTQTSTRCG